MAPYIDALWTPPYWEFYGGRYHRHRGYWGRHIGFYGGINYGYGYTGLGFHGGYWSQGAFVYNQATANVDPGVVRYVYRHSVVNSTPTNAVSYYGGSGGITRAPTQAELVVRSETRVALLPAQIEHARMAAADRSLLAAENRGRPPMPVLVRPLATTYRAPAPLPRSWQREAAQQAPRAAPAANVPPRGEPPAPAPAPQRRTNIEPPQPQAEPHAAGRGRVETWPGQAPSLPGRVGAPPEQPAYQALQGVRQAPPPQMVPAPMQERPTRQQRGPVATNPTPPPQQEVHPESPRQPVQAPPNRPSPFAIKPTPAQREAPPAPQRPMMQPPPPGQEVRHEPSRPMVQAPSHGNPAPPPNQAPQATPPGRGGPPPEKGPPRDRSVERKGQE